MIIFWVHYFLAFFFLTSSALGSMNAEDLVTEIDKIIASKVPDGKPCSPAAVIAALDDPAMKDILRNTIVKSFPFSYFNGYGLTYRGVKADIYHKFKLADVNLTVTRKLPLGKVTVNRKYSIERRVNEAALERHESRALENLICWAGMVFFVHLVWLVFGTFEEAMTYLFTYVGMSLLWTFVHELIIAGFTVLI